MQPTQARKLISSSADAVSRVVKDNAAATGSLDASRTRERVDRVLRPKSVGGGIRKLGIALVAMPDPFTGVPGVALLASSVVMKRREPASLSLLGKETRKILQEMESLRI